MSNFKQRADHGSVEIPQYFKTLDTMARWPTQSLGTTGLHTGEATLAPSSLQAEDRRAGSLALSSGQKHPLLCDFHGTAALQGFLGI